MFPFDGLDRSIELVFVFGVLVELGEHLAHVIHEELRQFLVGLEYKAEEFAMVVVHYVRQLLFER
jgi:hypothetical protein